ECGLRSGVLPLASCRRVNLAPGGAAKLNWITSALRLLLHRRAANISAKRRSASRCLFSVRVAVFPTRSEVKPSWQPLHRVPIETLPYATTVMQTEQEQC